MVSAIDEKYLTILYADGNVDVIELGRKHGTVSGTAVPHVTVTDLIEGKKVKKGDIVAWDDSFFTRDIFDPGIVSYKSGVMSTVVFWESNDTIEDGCVIGPTILDKLETPVAYCKAMVIEFDMAVHKLVKIGDELEHDSILCTLEEAVSASLTESDPEAVAALQQISAANPRAKTHGTVTNIEIVYYGDIADMHPTLQEIVKDGDRRRAARSKSLGVDIAKNGQIKESIHWGGTKLLDKNVGIKIYIDSDLGIGSGDKLVFSNALKTTISRVETSNILTENGDVVDAIFGYNSIIKRIVKSPEISGTMNKVLKTLSSEMVNIYKKG